MMQSFVPEETSNYEKLISEIATMEKSTPASPEFAMAMTDKASPITVNVHKRGNPGIAG